MGVLKKIALLFSLSLCVVFASAVPALKVKKVVVQSDGTSITLVRGGDEYMSYYSTTDGYLVVKDSIKNYRYVYSITVDSLVASEYLAHEPVARSATENSWLATNGIREAEALKAVRTKRSRSATAHRNVSTAHTGEQTIPVILVQYADIKFSVENPIDTFQKHFNAVDYTEEGGVGSVRDYFVAQSMGQYTPVFDILDIVTLPNNRSYYGGNSGTNKDVKINTMARKAVEQAEQDGIDFSKYAETNGQIPLVAIIYAGVGEHSSYVEDAVWAQYRQYTIRTKGGTIYSYLAASELFPGDTDDENELEGIGVFCHEFSHFLGLPDFYDTSGGGNIFGMSFWSVMDEGEYWKKGKVPVGYTAYEKNFMGWLDIDTLQTKKQICTLNALGGEEQNAFYILNDSDSFGNEYYILENRQTSTWYPRNLGSGMLVLHVDYDYSEWTNNTVNNDAEHQRMTIVPADGATVLSASATTADYKGDLFPGRSGVTSLGDDTSPAFSPYIGEKLGKYLTNITETDGKVSFLYMADGILSAPTDIRLGSENDSSMITWNTTENAETYRVVVFDGETAIDTFETTSPSINISVYDNATQLSVEIIAEADRYIDSPPTTATLENLLGVNTVKLNGMDDCVNVYTVEGMLVARNVERKTLGTMLRSGIYILRHSDGTAEKLYVDDK